MGMPSCRQGAHLLKKILTQLGAHSGVACPRPIRASSLITAFQVSGEPGRNPLVLATFSGQDTGKPRKRILFYGERA